MAGLGSVLIPIPPDLEPDLNAEKKNNWTSVREAMGPPR